MSFNHLLTGERGNFLHDSLCYGVILSMQVFLPFLPREGVLSHPKFWIILFPSAHSGLASTEEQVVNYLSKTFSLPVGIISIMIKVTITSICIITFQSSCWIAELEGT